MKLIVMAAHELKCCEYGAEMMSFDNVMPSGRGITNAGRVNIDKILQ